MCGAGVGLVKIPVLHIASFQELPDDLQKPVITDLSAEYTDQNVVVDIIEASGYIPFNDPWDGIECFSDLRECRVTAFARSETMGTVVKERLIYRFQIHPL